jgi:hypothetical protein
MSLVIPWKRLNVFGIVVVVLWNFVGLFLGGCMGEIFIVCCLPAVYLEAMKFFL